MHSLSPYRSTSLPSDIWLIIIQLVDEPTVKSLSLVNKLLRDVALPVVFNTLGITGPRITAPHYARLSVKCHLKQVLQRVHGIGSVPHIHDAIRRLNLISWNIDIPERDLIQTHTDAETIGLMSIAYDAIAQLVSSLPRLYRLDCQSCSLTPALSSSIMGSSTLEFLRIKSVPAKPKPHSKILPASLHIFEYDTSCSYQEDIVALVFSQVNQFTSLCLSIHTLLFYLSTTNFDKLQKLTVFSDIFLGSVSLVNTKRFYDFLRLIPNLRELRILGELSTAVSFSHTMRNLESLTAPSSIANDIISFGPPLKKMHIFTTGCPSEFPNDFKIISKDVEYVAYAGALTNPEKELTHLARMFPNVTSVQITATIQRQLTLCKCLEIFPAVQSILPDLPHLKQCGVFDLCKHPADLDLRGTVGFHCPVGRADDPKYRAHPTLEDVQILSCHRWIWIPEDGWRACDLRYKPVNLFRTF